MNVCFVIHLSYLPLALVNGLFCRLKIQSISEKKELKMIK